MGELKRATAPDGKPCFSKRVQFQIQDLLDLRQSGWRKKMFKETAKTTSEIRNDHNTEARLKAKRGQDAMFVTQIAGAKPAYMENVIKEARQMPKREAPQKQEWDQAYVKKLLSYYFEDKDGNELESKWKEGTPNAKEVKAALDTMIEVGFSDREKCDMVADAICELLQRRCLSWTQLDATLSGQLEFLEE